MSTIVRNTHGLSTTEYLLILLGIVVAGVFAWSTFSESLHQRSEDAALAIRDMQGRQSHATDVLIGSAQQGVTHGGQEQIHPDIEERPSAPSSSFLTRIHTLQQQNQTESRTIVPNAIFKTNASSSTSPTYIADSSGQRVDISNPQDLESLFDPPTSDSSAVTDAEREALTNLLITRGANPFAPIVEPSNPTSVEMSEGVFDSIEQIQQNPLGTGIGLHGESDFDSSTIGDNPFRPALENLPENGETPLESFQIRRKASALYVFSGLWDAIDALVHPGRTFHQLQELTQTLIYLPDYCYHNREVCQANMLAGLFITMDSLHRFETGQLHLSDKQVGMLEGAAIEIVLPGPEDTILDLAKLPSKVDNALDAVDSPNSSALLANHSPNAAQVCIRRANNSSPDCFAAGTLVQTKDGKVPIEDIQVGDSVLALHEETGQLGYFPVSHTLQNSNQPVRLIRIQGPGGIEERIVATAEHPFFSNHQPISLDAQNPMDAGTWMPAHDLQEGMWLVGPNGQPVKILGVEELADNADVHNLTVDQAHTYFVGDENSVLTHNAPVDPSKKKKEPTCGPQGCLVAGTIIQTEQGSVPIESLKKGDLVLALHSDTGQLGYFPISSVTTKTKQHLHTITVKNPSGTHENITMGESYLYTGEHTADVDGLHSGDAQWNHARDLRLGNWLTSPNGNPIYVVDTKIIHHTDVVHGYYFTTDGAHGYFAGQNQILVRNMENGLNDVYLKSPPNTKYPHLLFRGDSSIPPEIAFERGFRPGGKHNDIKAHTQGTYFPALDTTVETPGNFMSTTVRYQFARMFAYHKWDSRKNGHKKSQGWLYHIYPDSVTDIDVNQAVPDHKWEVEYEIATQGPIPPQRIMGAQVVYSDGTLGEFIWNPNRVGPIVPTTPNSRNPSTP